MDATRLRSIMKDLGISQVDLARLLNVTARAVNMWATDNRQMPGPVVAYVNLLAALPKHLLAQELARLREAPMHEGMYSFWIQGAQGTGLGVMVLQAGYVFGSDGGVSYDGHYSPSSTRPGWIDINLRVTVPPGIGLIQGQPPQPATYNFDLLVAIQAGRETKLTVQTPYGPVVAKVNFIRELPRDLAA